MKSDFYTAIAQIAAERGIPREAVISSVEHALQTVYKKMTGSEEEVDVDMDSDSGQIRIYVTLNVVEQDTEELGTNDIRVEDSRKPHPEAVVGDQIRIDKTPKNFGRIAAQTAKQV